MIMGPSRKSSKFEKSLSSTA